MIPDKAPKEDVFHGSEELKKQAHIPSFDKYKELYLQSIEDPDGKSLCLRQRSPVKSAPAICKIKLLHFIHKQLLKQSITEVAQNKTPPMCIVPVLVISYEFVIYTLNL